MKQSRIIYEPQYTPSPVSFWVHRHLDSEIWRDASEFDPPLPKPIPGRGWPRLEVEVDDVLLTFSSLVELEHVIDVLSCNPLPTTRRLATDRGTTYGPNSHWLSRLPAKAKSKGFRSKLVKYLRRVSKKYENIF